MQTSPTISILVLLLYSLVPNCQATLGQYPFTVLGHTCYQNHRGEQSVTALTPHAVVSIMDDLPTNDRTFKLMMVVYKHLRNYYRSMESDFDYKPVSVFFRSLKNENSTYFEENLLMNVTEEMRTTPFYSSSYVCYIFTTSNPRNVTRAAELATKVQEMGINIVVVGFGQNVDKSKYLGIATNRRARFLVDQYLPENETVIEQEGKRVAQSVLKAVKQAAFLPKFISCFKALLHLRIITDVHRDPQETLKAIRTFARLFDKDFTTVSSFVLNTAFSEKRFRSLFDNIHYDATEDRSLYNVSFSIGMICHTMDHDHREAVVIVVVDDRLPDVSDLHEVSEECQQRGVHIMALGIGDKVRRTELEAIVSDPRGLEVVDSDEGFVYSLAKVYKNICHGICPPTWLTHEGSCYYYGENKQPWLAAQSVCTRLGVSLVSITSPAKHAWLKETFINEAIQNNKAVFIGLRKYAVDAAPIGKTFRWEDGKPLVFSNWEKRRDGFDEPDGASYEECVLWGAHGWQDISCSSMLDTGYICEMKSMFVPQKHEDVIVEALWDKTPCVKQNGTKSPILVKGKHCAPVFNMYMDQSFKQEVFACSSGELVSKFLQCDGRADCLDASDELQCGTSCNEEQLECDNGRCVALAVVCDFWNDCGDNSDELRCQIGPCEGSIGKQCTSGQCIYQYQFCDMVFNCFDESDEADCSGDSCQDEACHDGSCIPWSWVKDGTVDCPGGLYEDERQASSLCYHGSYRELHYLFRERKYRESRPECTMVTDGLGKRLASFSLSPKKQEYCNGSVICPVGFHRCPNSYCIPIAKVCDGEMDCINGEEEYGCETYHCPGYFRCPNSRICIHPAHVCDRDANCPGARDEIMCYFDRSCPVTCNCTAGVVTCERFFPTDQNYVDNLHRPFDRRTRKLTLRESHFNDWKLLFNQNYLLISFTIINSDLASVKDVFTSQISLTLLNVSSNKINVLPPRAFSTQKMLTSLDISYNPVHSISNSSFVGLENLRRLYLKNTALTILRPNLFSPLEKLKLLDLQGSSIMAVRDEAFMGLESLLVLYIQGNPITEFRKHIFKGIDHVTELHTGVYSLCCSKVRPRFVAEKKCYAPKSSISSCDDLLNSDILRSSIWIICIAAIFGNVASTIMRIALERPSLKIGYGVFVTHLGIADFLMGIYLLIIAIADARYRGNYIWYDYEWSHSLSCKLTGALSTLSSEASMMFICLITIDRFLVIKFPFGKIRFRFKSATLVSVLTWFTAAVLASIPLLPPLDHWEFYSKSGACLALPYTTERRPGWVYSTMLFVCFNFGAFILMAIGQLSIYREVRSASMLKNKQRSAQEMAIARRLFLIVATDFLCWFPIGVMSILALAGVPLGGEAYAWTAVFILPVNSALNPFFYTIPAVMQNLKRRQQRTKEVSTTTTTVHIGEPDNKSFIQLRDALEQMKTHDDKTDLLQEVFKRIMECLPSSDDVKSSVIYVNMSGKFLRSIYLAPASQQPPDDILKNICSLLNPRNETKPN